MSCGKTVRSQPASSSCHDKRKHPLRGPDSGLNATRAAPKPALVECDDEFVRLSVRQPQVVDLLGDRREGIAQLVGIVGIEIVPGRTGAILKCLGCLAAQRRR